MNGPKGASRYSLLLLACLLVPAAASGEVKLKIGEDGIPYIYNETSEQRQRRLATDLVSMPDADLGTLIEHHAERQRLAGRLVRAVIQVESGYNPKARSKKGAMGLMQLMPETAAELRVADAYDPDQNIRGGTAYLRRLLDRFGDLELALAAYNAGPTAVDRYQGVPPYKETRGYIQRVLSLYRNEEVTEVDTADNRPRPRIYVTRDAQNRLVLTTTPPAKPR